MGRKGDTLSETITNAEYAYLSGLILGWSDALTDPNQVGRVIKDMKEISKKLAEKGGIEVE